MTIKKIALTLGFVFLGTFSQMYSMNYRIEMDFAALGVTPKTDATKVVKAYRNNFCSGKYDQDRTAIKK